MTRLIIAALRRLGDRVAVELLTRAGRRRLGRRLASRGLVLLPILVWTHLFFWYFWSEELTRYVRGHVVVNGPAAPVLDLAVVLVPDPVAPGADAGYLRVDPGLYELPDVEGAAVWLWPDVDGRFDVMHVAGGERYRVEVRWASRPDCPPYVVGHRVFRLLDFFSRRLELVVPPCPV